MPRASSTLKVATETRATTASVQDYLAAIYDLAGSGKPVIGARLAKHLGISAPAVTEAIHRMARGGYVRIGRGKELTLSPKGRQIAEVMARRHRLLERWLKANIEKYPGTIRSASVRITRTTHRAGLRPEVKVLLVSGYPRSVIEANEPLGDFVLIAKPYRMEELLQGLRRAAAVI